MAPYGSSFECMSPFAGSSAASRCAGLARDAVPQCECRSPYGSVACSVALGMPGIATPTLFIARRQSASTESSTLSIMLPV
jgi:hypothetical protein